MIFVPPTMWLGVVIIGLFLGVIAEAKFVVPTTVEHHTHYPRQVERRLQALFEEALRMVEEGKPDGNNLFRWGEDARHLLSKKNLKIFVAAADPKFRRDDPPDSLSSLRVQADINGHSVSSVIRDNGETSSTGTTICMAVFIDQIFKIEGRRILNEEDGLITLVLYLAYTIYGELQHQLEYQHGQAIDLRSGAAFHSAFQGFLAFILQIEKTTWFTSLSEDQLEAIFHEWDGVLRRLGQIGRRGMGANCATELWLRSLPKRVQSPMLSSAP